MLMYYPIYSINIIMGWEIHIFIQKKSGIYHGMEDFIMYKFTDDYLIGIDEIDNEHRRLFQMINEAIDFQKKVQISRYLQESGFRIEKLRCNTFRP